VNHQHYQPFQNWTSLEVLSVGLSPTVFHEKKHHGEGCLNNPVLESLTIHFSNNHGLIMSSSVCLSLTIYLELTSHLNTT